MLAASSPDVFTRSGRGRKSHRLKKMATMAMDEAGQDDRTPFDRFVHDILSAAEGKLSLDKMIPGTGTLVDLLRACASFLPPGFIPVRATTVEVAGPQVGLDEK